MWVTVPSLCIKVNTLKRMVVDCHELSCLIYEEFRHKVVELEQF